MTAYCRCGHSQNRHAGANKQNKGQGACATCKCKAFMPKGSYRSVGAPTPMEKDAAHVATPGLALKQPADVPEMLLASPKPSDPFGMTIGDAARGLTQKQRDAILAGVNTKTNRG